MLPSNGRVLVANERMLVVEGVSKRFARASGAIQAVAELSLALDGGQIVLLLGSNGAGKSTLLRMIAGLIEPSTGAIRIDGREQRGTDGALQRAIGWCSSDERSFYPRLSVRENLRLFAALAGLDRRTADERITERSATFGLAGVLDRKFQACSTGERQKVNLIRALLHDPKLLLLDEPARSLDARTRATLARVLREFAARPDRLVLLASHDFEGLEDVGQRVVILDAGREILSGTTDEIASHLGDAYWQLAFRSSAARDAALATCSLLRPDVAGANALCSAPQGGLPPELAQCVVQHAREIERIERRAGPSLNDLLVRIARGERIDGPRASATAAATAPAARAPAATRPRPPALRVLGALARRDRIVFLSYRFQIGLRLGVLVAWMLSMYFVAQLVDRGSPQAARFLSGDYFTYVLLGITFLRISQVCLIQMTSALREEQLQGTIEPLVATGEPSFMLLIGGLLWPLASEIAGLLLVFGSGAALLGAQLSVVNLPAFVLAAAATVLAMLEWGLLSAAFVIAFKRGDPVALLVNLISVGLSGVYFPVELLPGWLRPMSHILPLTWGLDAVRAAAMRGAGFDSPEYTHALLGLACLIALLAPVALWCQRRAFGYARRQGSLTQV